MKTTAPRLSGLLAAVLAGAMALSSPALAQISVSHVKGETTLPETPQKVLVLDIPSLDTLTALGVDVAGVPGSNLPPYLSQYAADNYLKVGTLFEPDYEVVNAAEADLMIIGGRSSAKYPELSAMLPTIDLTVDAKNYIASVKSNVTTLGKIFGKDAEAAKLLSDLDAKFDALKAEAVDAGTALILLVNGGKVTAYGPASRVGWLHNEIGFKTVSEDIEEVAHGDAVSFEYILEKNPDWLFVIDRDAGVGQGSGQAAAQVLGNELVSQTTAWKENQVVYLDPVAAYIVSSGYAALSTLADQVLAEVSAR